MSLLTDIADFKARVKTRILDKTTAKSIKKADVGDSLDELADLLVQTLPDGIMSGLSTTISGSNAIVAAGVWKIWNNLYTTTSDTSIPYDPQDATLTRYDVIYADADGNINILSGQLASTPIEPSYPQGTVKIASILITPNEVVIQPPPVINYVDTLTDQIINGFKTFLQSPQVPTATGPNDAVPFSQIEGIENFDTILDDDDDFVSALLTFINNSNITLHYEASGTQNLAPAGEYPFNYNDADPNDAPLFDFDPNYLYSIEPDDIVPGDGSYLTSLEAANKIALFLKPYAEDYVASNGNGNVNIDAKNLIVTVDDAEVSFVSQLQVKDVPNNIIRYTGLPSGGIQFRDNLLPSTVHQVLVASTDDNMIIAITAANLSEVLYKTKEFLSTDPDNSLTAPITIALYPAP